MIPIAGDIIYYKCPYKKVTPSVIRDMIVLAEENKSVLIVLECATGEGCIYKYREGDWVLHAKTQTV